MKQKIYTRHYVIRICSSCQEKMELIKDYEEESDNGKE